MLDFLMISTRSTKRGVIEIYPRFIAKTSSDLMIRGGDFYAIWVEERGLWSTDEEDALRLIDNELDIFAEENKMSFDGTVRVMHLWDVETGMIDVWHKYCQKQMWDSYHMLDEKLIFANSETKKKDYASKRLPYPLEKGSIEAYDTLVSTLYSPKEKHKIEWAIGSIVTGDSKKLQKFMVLYGAAGTGKSTVINIIEKLFEGYFSVFDSKALGSASSTFALESFKTNPLVAIEHDGDLSRIEDNTRLNSLVSHEKMTVNEKFKSTYTNNFKCFLIMGTNKPVRITDAKSGLLRRLIDVTPTGDKVGIKEYNNLVKQIAFELGAIAWHCKEVYLEDEHFYDTYIPLSMLSATNDFYNFVFDSFYIFKQEDSVTLKVAWEMYKNYCEEAKVPYPYTQRVFKEELKNYFKDYKERFTLDDSTRVRSYYHGFKVEKFVDRYLDREKKDVEATWRLEFNCDTSIFDKVCENCPAQYATDKETPMQKWDKVETCLSEIDTSKLHYVKVPENHIVVDFDIPDESGNKCLEKNLEEASKWPKTYAELSKSGQGIHLHYIYNGDVDMLSRVYEEHIEVKVFTGKSSLRRRLTKCNDIPIATISSGLPLKGEMKMVTSEQIKSEKSLRTLIKRNLNKEIHPATKPSIDFIYKILEDAYASGLQYDVSDMYTGILIFASQSSNQSDYCKKIVDKMKFKSDAETAKESVDISSKDDRLIFYDVEVFPNLFLVNWKFEGEGKPVIRMINPTPEEVSELTSFKLVGFNNRRYDNHMLYARIIGYSNQGIYELSQKIISSKKGENNQFFFADAYNLSYTDVYDFSAQKKSLKKWEIELGIHHQELGLPWDQPVPEERWLEVAEYCDNDVIATEAVFNHLKADWTARQILADLANGSVNDTTNSLSTKIIFGKERNPQYQFNYRFLGNPIKRISPGTKEFLEKAKNDILLSQEGKDSVLPYFPGYSYDKFKRLSTYRGEEVGEGGYVYAEPGMYGNVALLDIQSMHPNSIISECLFGPEYTMRFKEIVDARVAIKHGDLEKARCMLGGMLKKYLNDPKVAKDLSNALKIVINSIYGLTAAGFSNPFKDPNNEDNIVAKRGALFMLELKHEVQNRGFKVAHIKTDSIKIPDATDDIIQFVMDFGKRYGYKFEHEATYDRMTLVNNAVYIAKYKGGEDDGKWTATGKQFAVPYLFKTLFSHEPINFEDLCETYEVKTSLYLDMNENLPDVSMLEHEKEKLSKLKNTDDTELNRRLARIEELDEQIANGHDYHFIGRVGLFCPMKPGCGGGILLRQEKDGRYSAATGSTGYRWMEAEMVKALGLEDCIDRSYYDKLVSDAVNDISQHGDFEWFVSEDPYVAAPIEYVPWYEDDTIPFE